MLKYIFNSLTAYQTQLHKKLKQLLETFDSDAFLSKFGSKTSQFSIHVLLHVSQFLLLFFFWDHMVTPNFFLVLKIIAVTRELNTLQKKVKLASNSTEGTTEVTGECCFTSLFYICWQSFIIFINKYLSLAATV